MATPACDDDRNNVLAVHVAATGRHVLVFVAGLWAAWFAAGSTGMLGHPMQRAMTWLAIGAAVIAAWPDKRRSVRASTALAVGVILSLLFTSSAIPAVNVLAVAVLLGAIAQTCRGLVGRLALVAALAAFALAGFRFACGSNPVVWHAADSVGWLLGRIAGWLTNSSLTIGATFAGLDFLVPIAVVYVAWLSCTAPPRRGRALRVAAAIVAGHGIYLAALASSEHLLAWLPKPSVVRLSDINHVGLWAWGDGLRTLIPWNLPLLALVIHGATLAAMVRSASWLVPAEGSDSDMRREEKKKEEISGAKLGIDMIFGFAPPLLAVAASLLATWTTNSADLRGKTIVAYESAAGDWVRPQYDSENDGPFGMLPPLIESLGGKFVLSKDLSKDELAKADALLLLRPDQPPQETLRRTWDYVRGGGSVLLAADPAVVRLGVKKPSDATRTDAGRSVSKALEPLAIRIEHGKVVPRAGGWEQSYDTMVHPATAGLDDPRNPFGVRRGPSLDIGWPARPMLVARWGWNGAASPPAVTSSAHAEREKHEGANGRRFGDLVLAAEQRCGAGRIVVLGDTSALRNEMLPGSYPFIGRLLGYLANRSASPLAPWRQTLALAALATMLALLCCRPTAWQIMLTSTLMGAALVYSGTAAYWSGRVLPDGRAGGVANLAYIDASHLESCEGGPADRRVDRGIAGLLRTLMRHGYLPLLASDLSKERLERAQLLFTIGPMRAFSAGERAGVKEFVEADGGTLIALVGAEESRASAPLLADFGFKVPPSPVPPGDNAREPEPLGAKTSRFADEGDQQYQFYAAWPIECGSDANVLSAWSEERDSKPIIASRSIGNGSVVVIADTHLAGNENFGPADHPDRDVIQFWRWMLSRVVPDQKAWNPPPRADDAAATKGAADAVEDDGEEANEGGSSVKDEEPPEESEL